MSLGILEKMKQITLKENKMSRIILNRGESHCCGATVWENQDICNSCGEHCEVIDYEDEAEDFKTK